MVPENLASRPTAPVSNLLLLVVRASRKVDRPVEYQVLPFYSVPTYSIFKQIDYLRICPTNLSLESREKNEFSTHVEYQSMRESTEQYTPIQGRPVIQNDIGVKKKYIRGILFKTRLLKCYFRLQFSLHRDLDILYIKKYCSITLEQQYIFVNFSQYINDNIEVITLCDVLVRQ